MLVLEILTICRSQQIRKNRKLCKDNEIFDHPENTDDIFEIWSPRMGALRYILFQDASLEQIAEEKFEPDERKNMRKWIKELNGGYKKAVRNDSLDFDYLLKNFEDEFADILSAVKILRGLELDILNKRRWTSRFLAPRGVNLLLSDLDRNLNVDRRFFGRGGEMVYLMLKRSSHAVRLAEELKKQFFDHQDRLDQIASRLMPSALESDKSRGHRIGYLPLRKHYSYNRMAEDWLSILSLGELPIPQKFDPLFRITALNLVSLFCGAGA